MKDGMVYSFLFHLSLVLILLAFAPFSEINKIDKKVTPIKVRLSTVSSVKSLMVRPTQTPTKIVKKPTVKPTKVVPATRKPTKAPTKIVKKPTRKPTKVAPPTRKPTKAPTKTVKKPTRKPTKVAPPTRKPTKVPTKRVKKPTVRPIRRPPDFGMSIADRLKNAWSDDEVDNSASVGNDKPSDDGLVQLAKATSDSSLDSLPHLPDFDLPQIDFSNNDNPLNALAAPVPGMRTGGTVSSEDSWYLSDVKGKLNDLWIRPATIIKSEESCELAFRILPDGEVREMRISSGSGNLAFDNSVLTALRRVDKFEPLPESIGTKVGETFFLTFVLSR